MDKTLKGISQILFLLLFVALIFIGKIQIWMAIFLVSVILALFFGRFYCGFICPINTVMGFASKIKSKFQIKGMSEPDFMKKPVFRYAVLATFIFTFSFVMKTGKKLPVLPALLLVGVVSTLLFSESLWHRYICPYGTILHFVGSLSKRFYCINDDLCISCGKCYKVCPAEAVQKDKDKYMINKSECLVCGKCAENCNKDAINYQ